MADHTNMQVHGSTYSRLIALLKWGAVACFLIAFAVIWIISPAGK